MRRWVVTGPMAAGKSLVTEYLAGRGAVVVNADHLGHEVLTEAGVISEIQAAFTADVLTDGQVDRKKLGALVFADQAAMLELNRITHHRISALAGERLAQLESQGQHPLVVLEAAMFFFFPDPPAVDLTIAVTAAKDIRQKRLLENRGFDQDLVQQVFQTQQELEKRCQKADVVLVNDADQAALFAQIDGLLRNDG